MFDPFGKTIVFHHGQKSVDSEGHLSLPLLMLRTVTPSCPSYPHQPGGHSLSQPSAILLVSAWSIQDTLIFLFQNQLCFKFKTLSLFTLPVFWPLFAFLSFTYFTQDLPACLPSAKHPFLIYNHCDCHFLSFRLLYSLFVCCLLHHITYFGLPVLLAILLHQETNFFGWAKYLFLLSFSPVQITSGHLILCPGISTLKALSKYLQESTHE